MRRPITPLWRYPMHKLTPFMDATGWNLWAWGVLFHGTHSGLMIGWLRRERASTKEG